MKQVLASWVTQPNQKGTRWAEPSPGILGDLVKPKRRLEGCGTSPGSQDRVGASIPRHNFRPRLQGRRKERALSMER